MVRFRSAAMGAASPSSALPRAGAMALLAADLLLIAVYTSIRLELQGTGRPPPTVWDLTRDGSLAESLNLLKWSLAALFLAHAATRDRAPALMPLAAVYLVLLADDGLQLHERAGAAAAAAWGLPRIAGLRPEDAGELAAWAAMGTVVLLLFARAWRRAGAGGQGRAVARLFALFLALVACGVGLDMVHSLMADGRGVVVFAVTLAEDGGEMLFASLTVIAAARPGVRGRGAPG